jgi:MFS transporter, MHS family, alpha-ketoglutarate permease
LSQHVAHQAASSKTQETQRNQSTPTRHIISAPLPPPTDLPAAASKDKLRRLRSIFSGSVGNLIEWYVCSAFALYFARSFFLAGNQAAHLLNTAAVFAVGFLARPIGGWLMGVDADRHGHRSVLLFSVVLLCAGSLIIALCPSDDIIGVVARLLQGLSHECGTSATYLSEVATAHDRGFYFSFRYFSRSTRPPRSLQLVVANGDGRRIADDGAGLECMELSTHLGKP